MMAADEELVAVFVLLKSKEGYLTGALPQIDLIIDRGDFVINICEMKFSEKELAIDKVYAANLQNKIDKFQEQTGSKKELHLTLVTTFGVKENQYEDALIARAVSMNYLFS